MDLDPTNRWKGLEMLGNRSPTAWFIVVKSFMRNAHTLSDGMALSEINGSDDHVMDKAEKSDSDPSTKLAMLASSLNCFSIACLAYKDEYLSFSSSGMSPDFSLLQHDSAIHSIHLMTHLTRFRIYHHEFFRQHLGKLRWP